MKKIKIKIELLGINKNCGHQTIQEFKVNGATYPYGVVILDYEVIYTSRTKKEQKQHCLDFL